MTASTEKSAVKSAVSPAKNSTKKTITIRLKKGLIACNPKQRATVSGLGLKRREQQMTLENTPSVRGMIKKVLHLVEVVSESR